MIYVVVIGGTLYAFLIAWFMSGWVRLPEFDIKDNEPVKEKELPHTPFFSIVVAARNEESRIYQTLQCLFQQNFPLSGYEVHVVDDHSTDQTWQVLKDFANHFPHIPFHFHMAPATENPRYVAFKKNAITTGISKAKGQWIVTTDADCQTPPNWLKTFYRFIQEHQSLMISGPVTFSGQEGVFKKLQGLEFMALIGIGAATLRQGVPSMCNGANLAYKRDVFREVKGFENFEMLASGDDEFLMHKVYKQYPGRVHFLKSRSAMVKTLPQTSLKGLWQQRVRWASKGPYYEGYFLKALTVLVGGYHLLLLLLFLGIAPLKLTVIAMGLKVLPESLFLTFLAPFFKRSKSFLLLYLPAAVLYPFYVVVIGVASQIKGYQWKGRKVR